MLVVVGGGCQSKDRDICSNIILYAVAVPIHFRRIVDPLGLIVRSQKVRCGNTV